MPPMREHEQTLEDDQSDGPSASEPARERQLQQPQQNKRATGRKSPSINTRASRVGVTNFINVIKSLHPGESITYFPITKETLHEYIDSKRKALIKAGSLEQYLQHIQAYNIALGYGWNGQVFGPIIKKALDELRVHEEEAARLLQQSQALAKPRQQSQSQPQHQHSPGYLPQSTTPAADVIMMLGVESDTNPTDEGTQKAMVPKESPHQSHTSANGKARASSLTTCSPFASCARPGSDQIYPVVAKDKKVIPVVCFDRTIAPFVPLEQQASVTLRLPTQNLRQLHATMAAMHWPPSWEAVDTSCLHYQMGVGADVQQLDESAFPSFLNAIRDDHESVQLVLYRGSTANASQQQDSPGSMTSTASSPSRQNFETSTLRSVTVRSRTRVYKQKIAVTETTTFGALVSFAIKASPPNGKQFVILDADGSVEYMPNHLVREVITGVEHADVLVSLENAAPPVDFERF